MYSPFNWHRHQAQIDSNSTQSILCIIYSTYMSCIYRMEWKDGHRFYLRYPMYLARTILYDLRCWIFHLEVEFVYCFCCCCKSIKFNLILNHFDWMHVNVIEMVCVCLMDSNILRSVYIWPNINTKPWFCLPISIFFTVFLCSFCNKKWKPLQKNFNSIQSFRHLLCTNSDK